MRGVYYLCDAKRTKTNIPLMYEVLDKDTIKSEILPHLSVAKRGYALKSNLLEIIILCILYKLKRKTTNAIYVTDHKEIPPAILMCSN